MITGILTGASVDIVPSPVGRMEGMNSHAMWLRTHTPEYTVTHKDAKQVWGPAGSHYTAGSH